MKPKPMTFTTANVPLLMADLKTRSSRIMGPQPDEDGFVREIASGKWYDTSGREYKPRYQPGDIVYVAEGYQVRGYLLPEEELSPKNPYLPGNYLADGESFVCEVNDQEYEKWMARKYPYRKTNGRFMYRSLARTYLKILDVRAERIQDISDEDCFAEGCRPCLNNKFCDPSLCDGCNTNDNTWWFKKLWVSIHGPGAWDLNPWVWSYSFKRLHK